jgi:PPOX class probable F420-dependent enzyme
MNQFDAAADLAVHGADGAPPPTHVDLLERPIFAHLATVRADGWPLSNPMWFLWEPGRRVIKLTHTTMRSNYRNLQREPRVSLSIADPDDQYRYLQVRGVVEAVEPDPEGAFYQVLQRRYRGLVTEVKDRDVRVVVTVRPVAYRAYGRPRRNVGAATSR